MKETVSGVTLEKLETVEEPNNDGEFIVVQETGPVYYQFSPWSLIRLVFRD